MCIAGCTPREEQGEEAKKQPATPPKETSEPCPLQKKECHHPVNCTSTLIAKNLDFGLKVKVTWESPTGSLADLGTCNVTEKITYSNMPNPPFQKSDGSTLKESGQSQRIPSGSGIAASSGVAQDTHRHPRALVKSPPSAGSYTVTQTYDYNCSVCGCGWVPFVNYTITYTVYEKKPGEWWFKVEKTGPGGPFVSDEPF